MDNVATFFGWFCIAVLCVAVACAAVAAAAHCGARLVERLEHAGAAKARREIGAEIISGAHWFGEHKPAADVLTLVGQRIRDGYRFDPDDVREEWRRRGAAP